MSPANLAIYRADPVPDFHLPSFHLGPMSLHTVDAAIALAYQNKTNFCLIGSRRQIECAAFGGGYVNGWSTETLSQYVAARDPENRIILARDHGGPYQRDEEKDLPLNVAMDRVKQSLKTDIDAGFQVLHLDPEKAVQRNQPDSLKNFTDLTIDLLVHASKYAVAMDRDVYFEIGSDEGPGEDFTPDEWRQFLTDVFAICDRENIRTPMTLAVPMGTKVKELRNVGGLVSSDNGKKDFWQDRVATLKKMASEFGVQLKLHNSDYLDAESVAAYRQLGIGYINVAPEFGVVESRAFLALLRKYNMLDAAEHFINLALSSNKWQRWLIPGSAPDDEEKAMIAGHYVFSAPEFVALKKEAAEKLSAQGVDLNLHLQKAVEKAIQHYLV